MVTWTAQVSGQAVVATIRVSGGGVHGITPQAVRCGAVARNWMAILNQRSAQLLPGENSLTFSQHLPRNGSAKEQDDQDICAHTHSHSCTQSWENRKHPTPPPITKEQREKSTGGGVKGTDRGHWWTPAKRESPKECWTENPSDLQSD